MRFDQDSAMNIKAIDSLPITVETKRKYCEKSDDGQTIIMRYTVMIDGYEVEATMVYDRSYEDESKYHEGSGHHEWDSGSLRVGGWDIFKKTFGWKVYAKAVETLLELDEMISARFFPELA